MAANFAPSPPFQHVPGQFYPHQNGSAVQPWLIPLPRPFPLPSPPYFNGPSGFQPNTWFNHTPRVPFPRMSTPRPPHNMRNHSRRGRMRHESNKPAAFSCSACSKEYRTEENYQIHMQSHEKCSKCDFEAVPRVLREHELIHLLPPELKFSSPEEISKWREERKKNYPTAANIARKAALAAEKKARGEVAQTPLHRYINHLLGEDKGHSTHRGRGFRRRGRGRGGPYNQHRGYNRRGGYRGRRFGRGNGREYQGQGSDTVEMEMDGNLECSDGASVSPDPSLTSHGSVEKEEEDQQTESNHQQESAVTDGILGAIMADVAVVLPSSTGDLESGADESRTEQDHGNSVGQEREVEEPACSEAEEERRKQESGKVRKRGEKTWVSRRERKRRKFTRPLQNVPHRKPTLLEMLLAPEIRREQNAILQCVHYVISQDFLGVGN